MLSSQRLCPSSCSFAVAFTVTSSGRGWLGGALERLASYPGDLVRSEAELGLDVLEGSRLAESAHRHDRALHANVALPALRRALLDRDPGADAGRQHPVAVSLILALEQLPAGEADDA